MPNLTPERRAEQIVRTCDHLHLDDDAYPHGQVIGGACVSCITTALRTVEAETEQKMEKCVSCGEPLSRNCESCKRQWSS